MAGRTAVAQPPPERARLAAQLYPENWRVPNTPLIAHSSWCLDEPIELRSLGLELDESRAIAALSGGEPKTMPVRPQHVAGVHVDRYTAAVKHLDPPRLFESRPSYRLLDAASTIAGSRSAWPPTSTSSTFPRRSGTRRLSRACATAPAYRPPSSYAASCPSGKLIGDPFAPDRRAIIPAITTLTIRLRRHPVPPAFLLHWRDPARVATAGGTYDVLLAGEFQPSSVALWDRRSDFDLWRNIVREYAEEVLGAPEHDGTRSSPIDYNGWPLYRDLDAAFSAGTLTADLLGLGLDALTLAATILTVVIDDDVFEQAFVDVVHYNDEGEIVAIGHSRPAEGVTFTRESVDRLLTSEPMASPGAACLALAWRHRSQLLGL